ncbi:MAG: LiaI-LiaF-like domain-containing protein [Anaerolineales bacterium]
MRASPQAPVFFPILLILLGIVILLNNFLLIEADVVSLWPLLLIIVGLGVLWRGDLAPSWQAHTFGITRGSVESASVEINSGEIDVRLGRLDRTGRLIAGQYTARSRPRLAVRNNHATLNLQRGHTWLFSLADWELGIAADLPWAVLMSAHVGKLQADLRGITVAQAHIASGFGDIRVIGPTEIGGPIYVRSNFGDIDLVIPASLPALIQVTASPLCRIISDDSRFERDRSGAYYAARAYHPEQPYQEIIAVNAVGNITLRAID